MEFEIFNDLDLEFFELSTQTPANEEQVVILLKSGVDDGDYRSWARVTGTNPIKSTVKVTLDYATYYSYKTRSAKFKCRTKYRSRTFSESDIICWGRIKQD